mmetsp:Transcript_10206/g.26289  ORF Transcript_10206/g.26289 Transcript_10206/m.26289 type:complete len:218 (+) Transcript_10206:480-1133(+)
MACPPRNIARAQQPLQRSGFLSRTVVYFRAKRAVRVDSLWGPPLNVLIAPWRHARCDHDVEAFGSIAQCMAIRQEAQGALYTRRLIAVHASSHKDRWPIGAPPLRLHCEQWVRNGAAIIGQGAILHDIEGLTERLHLGDNLLLIRARLLSLREPLRRLGRTPGLTRGADVVGPRTCGHPRPRKCRDHRRQRAETMQHRRCVRRKCKLGHEPTQAREK